MIQSKPREDNYLHRGLRRQLIQSLRAKGIEDEKVLAAMDSIPRHFFLDPAFERQAYEDRAFPITAGQTISHPYTVAYQTQLLNIKKFEKVLEIGTGSAYQACVLGELGVMLYTIERQRALYDYVGEFFFMKKYPNVKRFYGDGFEGLPSYGPFDKILITCGAPFLPPKLLEQLKPNGIMVAPVGEDGQQKMIRVSRNANGDLEQQEMGDFSFVPMLQGKNKASS